MLSALCYPQCSTCRRALEFLDEHHIPYALRHIKDDRPSYGELAAWFAMSGLPLKRFFNTSGLKYKELSLKDRLPHMGEEEQLRLLAEDGMLVKRPLLVDTERSLVLAGFREAEWARALL